MDYTTAITMAVVSIEHLKIDAFKASEVVGALFPNLDLEGIIGDIIKERE